MGYLNKLLKVLYPNIIPISRPEVPEGVIYPEWLVGFVHGESSFNVVTVEKMTNAPPTLSIRYKVWLYFQITQHSRDTLLLHFYYIKKNFGSAERIVSFIGCGSVKKNSNAVDFKLIQSEMMNNIIIPFSAPNISSSKC